MQRVLTWKRRERRCGQSCEGRILQKAICNNEKRVETKCGGVWAERAPEFRKSARCGISENVGIDDSRGSTRGQLVVRTVEGQWPRFFERFGERDPLVVYWRWPRTEGTSRPSPASGMGLEFREIKPHFRTVLQRWILAAMHQ